MQGLIPLLLRRITEIFPAATIYSPTDHGDRLGTDWPSMAEMEAAGKRLLLLSGVDYGMVMDPLIFDRSAPGAMYCSRQRTVSRRTKGFGLESPALVLLRGEWHSHCDVFTLLRSILAPHEMICRKLRKARIVKPSLG